MATEPSPPATPPPPPSSSSSPPTDPTDSENKYNGTPPVLHNAAIAVALIGPLGLLLPGRGRGTLSIQNAILGSGSFWALNQLAHDYTGKSILSRSNERWSQILGFAGLGENALPTERAREVKRLIEEERARQRRERTEETETDTDPKKNKGVLGRLWYGRETKEGWKERRLEEERKALESGKGYSDLIVEQIKQVWEGGDGKKDDKKKGDDK
ncbi:hypothetical protein QBC47DRAFT_377946 [Echria macrotheca]|uniref:Rhomboid family membrane protein n=1 Tax=Echria macrotheca TaxID=438768 RepID=A0AAJ0BER0_9PEZI|nr:hypothetical protein QBC47DRAFT_377946 [Echria macrotheca]